MNRRFNELLRNNPRLLILGFGKEGQSTYRFIRKIFPDYQISIADKNQLLDQLPDLQSDPKLELFLGENYLNSIFTHDLVIKSPGIAINHLAGNEISKITSQTDIFLEMFSKRIIGVTGTKGKSTTVSLIYHFLINNGKKTVLLGNIGIPPFDKLDDIGPETNIVFEMSAHQLEYVHHSPHIAVLLNIFPEHLDFFRKFENYSIAKKNIYSYQSESDVLIVEEQLKNEINNSISKKILFGRQSRLSAYQVGNELIIDGEKFIVNPNDNPLQGEHNVKNLMAALLAVREVGISPDEALACLSSFRTLPHRLEFVGNFDGIHFYNDSISTVPESAIAAIKTLPGTDIIILGGFDRGLDYSELVDFIGKSSISNIIFLGKAGDKMYQLFKSEQTSHRKLIKVLNLDEAIGIIKKEANKGTICLLSPAAASYDLFHNFEHRGDVFKELVRKNFGKQ